MMALHWLNQGKTYRIIFAESLQSNFVIILNFRTIISGVRNFLCFNALTYSALRVSFFLQNNLRSGGKGDRGNGGMEARNFTIEN